MVDLPLRPGTIVNAKRLATPKARPMETPLETEGKCLASPGVIVKVRDGSPRAQQQKAFFEISSDTLGEVETRAVVLAEAADVRLQRLLELPGETSLEVQKHLYFSSASLSDYYDEWRSQVAVNTWKLVKNLCYFKLVPGLLALHKAKEQYQAAESDCTLCIRVLGQKQRQEDLFADTLRKIEQNKHALKELSKGKRPFIAGGSVQRQPGARPRSKGGNQPQRPPKSLCKENELSLRLKQEISVRMLVSAVLKAWSVYSAMSANLERQVEVVRRKHVRVIGQYCVAVWSRFAELRKEERVALRIVRGELAVIKKQKVFESWRDGISQHHRRAIWLSKVASILSLRSKSRISLSWRSYALHRRRKRLGWVLAAALNARLASVSVVQRWRSVIILSQTLTLRLKALASGEQLTPSSEDIEAATVTETIQGMLWQRESLSGKRGAWKEAKAEFEANEQRVAALMTGLSQAQKTRLIAKWSQLGEHRSIQELNAKAISLVVRDEDTVATIPCFSVVKYTPRPVVPEPRTIDDPLKRSVHLKYAKQQRDFPRSLPARKPPLPSKPLSPSPKVSVAPSAESRPRQSVLAPSRLSDRVDQDSKRLIQSVRDLTQIPYSFFTYSAQSALKDCRLPLKQLLLERWKHVLKARIVCGWKQAAKRRRLAVVLTIRYAVGVGKRFLRGLKRLVGSRVRNVDEVRKQIVSKRVVDGWSAVVREGKEQARRHYLSKAFRSWSSYLISKAEHLTRVLQAEEHYCLSLQRQALQGLRARALSARKPREFFVSLQLKRHFQAWRALRKGEIRAIS